MLFPVLNPNSRLLIFQTSRVFLAKITIMGWKIQLQDILRLGRISGADLLDEKAIRICFFVWIGLLPGRLLTLYGILPNTEPHTWPLIPPLLSSFPYKLSTFSHSPHSKLFLYYFYLLFLLKFPGSSESGYNIGVSAIIDYWFFISLVLIIMGFIKFVGSFCSVLTKDFLVMDGRSLPSAFSLLSCFWRQCSPLLSFFFFLVAFVRLRNGEAVADLLGEGCSDLNRPRTRSCHVLAFRSLSRLDWPLSNW